MPERHSAEEGVPSVADSFPPTVEPSNFRCIKCGYDLSGTALGGSCPECGAPISDSVAARGPGGERVLIEERAGYVGPVLVTIFCCVIGGVVSLVYTAKANSAAVAGEPYEFERNKKYRDGWMIASIILGLLIGVGQIAAIGFSP